jgi:hypothetical protein
VLLSSDKLTDCPAYSIAVRDGVRRALAHDGAERQGVLNLAFLVSRAELGDLAWVLALLVDAGVLRWAVSILLALRRLDRFASLALGVWISNSASRALAHGLVLPADALSCHGAGVFLANGSAHSVEAVTRLMVSAVLVVLALHGHARGHGVTLGARWAEAQSLVGLHSALGSASARCHAAWVKTLLADASSVVRAVGINIALSWKNINQVKIKILIIYLLFFSYTVREYND